MDKFNLENILKIKNLKTEIDFERALSIYAKLRWMVKENAGLKPSRMHLKTLIKDFEHERWSNIEDISKEQIEESDRAEKIVDAEIRFIQYRKNLIKKKLKSIGLNQQDLGKILSHRKNYISELINGVRPFSRNDLVIIHRILKIDLKYLVPPFIETDMAEHINIILDELNKPKLKLPTKNENPVVA